MFEDYQLRREEICIGWFCQRSIVGIGWSILGVVLLTYTVFYFKTGLMQLLANICDNMGMEEKQWREWQFFFFVMLLGASIAGLVDEFAPIAGVWIMIAYLVLIGLLTLIKFIVDIVRTHKVFRCLFAALCFLVGIGAVTMLVIECIEGYIYFFIPIICAFATVSFRYKKRQEVAQ